jgi:hypothetical protein
VCAAPDDVRDRSRSLIRHASATTAEDFHSLMPSARQRLVETRHFPEMLNDVARRNHRYACPTLSSSVNEACQQAEPSCVEVLHAGEIERHVRVPGLVQMRCPEVLVCTSTENQPAACPYDDALCLAE